MSNEEPDSVPGQPRIAPDRRIERLRIRCRLRGTLELCVLLQRALDFLDLAADEESVTGLEALLEETDDTILFWIACSRKAPLRHRRALQFLRDSLRP